MSQGRDTEISASRARSVRLLFGGLLLLLSGCTGAPDGVRVVEGFELQRYLGTWYEIARLDHSFERGMSNVSAQYGLREDGGVRVINRGFIEDKAEWKQAEGKAYFIGPDTVGQLKVSFFGPFYGGYNIMELDQQHYSYAMICGPNLDYLWILARDKVLPEDVSARLVEQAAGLGFQTKDLIWVRHDRDDPTF